MAEEKANIYPLLQQEDPVPLALTPKQADSTDSPTHGWKVYLKAVCVTLVASIGALSFGFTAAFSSPLLVNLTRGGNLTLFPEAFEGDDNCPYQVLIGPIAPIGAFFGALLSAVVVAIFGLVFAMMSAAVMFVMGWVLLGVSFFVNNNVLGFRAIILLGRFVTGFATGWIAATAPGYVAEIAPNDKLRGPLGSVILSAIGLGIFLSFLLGAYFSYWVVAFTFAGVSVLHFLLLLTLPESPRRRRNPLANARSLFKTKSNTTTALTSEEREANSMRRFARQAVIVVLLFALQQLIGPDVLTFYAGPLLIAGGNASQDEASAFPPNAAASLAIGLVQTVGAFASMLLLERIGRKIALFIGALGMGLGSVGLMIYFGVIDTPPVSNAELDNSSMVRESCLFTPTPNPDRGESLRPLAVVSMSVFIFSFISCWGPPLFSFGAEMFTDRWRGLGLGMAFASNWLCTAIITFLFPLIARGLGEMIGFGILFITATLTAIFIPFFVPETRGKPLGWSSKQDFSMKRNLMEFFQSFKQYFCFCCLWRSARRKHGNDL